MGSIFTAMNRSNSRFSDPISWRLARRRLPISSDERKSRFDAGSTERLPVASAARVETSRNLGLPLFPLFDALDQQKACRRSIFRLKAFYISSVTVTHVINSCMKKVFVVIFFFSINHKSHRRHQIYWIYYYRGNYLSQSGATGCLGPTRPVILFTYLILLFLNLANAKGAIQGYLSAYEAQRTPKTRIRPTALKCSDHPHLSHEHRRKKS